MLAPSLSGAAPAGTGARAECTTGASQLSGASLLLYRLCSRMCGVHTHMVQPLFVRCVWTLSSASDRCGLGGGATNAAAAGGDWSLTVIGDQLEQLLASVGQQRRAVRCSQLVARLRRCQTAAGGATTNAAALRFLLCSSRLNDTATPPVPPLTTPLTVLPTNHSLSTIRPVGDSRSGALACDDGKLSSVTTKLAPYATTTTTTAAVAAAASTRVARPREQSGTAEASCGGANTQLLRELLLALRGVDGTYLRPSVALDSTSSSSSSSCLPPIHQLQQLQLSVGSCAQLQRLLEVGVLYRRVRQFSERVAARGASAGQTVRALAAAVDEQLQRLYQLLAVLDTQLADGGGGLTLRRLVLWTREPRAQLRHLAALLERCGGATDTSSSGGTSGGGGGGGGALITHLFTSSQHGDPAVARCLRQLLAAACRPLLAMIADWMLDGVLADDCGELFIRRDGSVPDDRLWHDAYRLRPGQVPSFLSASQAHHVLVAGKSVNFMRRVCGKPYEHGGSAVAAAALRREYERCSAEALLCESSGLALASLIERVWRHTSRHVVATMIDDYALCQHLAAVRDFLLLRRGDFISHLLHQLSGQLQRPATALYLHNLTGALEAAVRATSAQSAPAHVLRRLDVQLLGRSPGDTGWDVFCLSYHSDGPISTVLTADHSTSYLMLFHALWRCQRLQFTLSDVWRRQAALWRRLRQHSSSTSSSLPAQRLMLTISALTAEMIHFARQLSYYTTFEVLECSWAELERRIAGAACLDDIVAAHQRFVAGLRSGLLLEPNSAQLLHQLRTLHNVVLEFEQQFGGVERLLLRELHDRQTYIDSLSGASAGAAGFGTDECAQQTEMARRRHFVQVTLGSLVSRFQTLALSYRRLVIEFIASLAVHQQMALQCLCFRLDFNQHYEGLDPRLSLSRTYQQRRNCQQKT